jgi:hypothetical protein
METPMKTKTKSILIKTLVALSLAVQLEAQSVTTNGLVAFFPLNGNANDATGNGNNGVAENTLATTNQFGQTNDAMAFTGDSWVFIPYSAAMATTNFSVSLEFNCQTNFDKICVLRSGAGTNSNDFYRGYEFTTFDNNSSFGLWDFDGLSDYGPGKCGLPLSDWQENVWYNLTFTQNGTNAQLFVNGVLAASAINTIPYAPAQSSPFYIGSNSSGSSDPAATPFDFFTGTICDVRFYNRGLSAGEVEQIYLAETGPQLNLAKAIKPSFSNLTIGTGYQLQVSADLNSWTNQGVAFTATNTTFDFPQYFDVSDWNKLFFRLQVTP